MALRPDGERGERGEPFLPKKWDGEDEFWHDLAVAWGRSVSELQASVSEEERSAWLSWRERNGPINPLKRLDVLFARLGSVVLLAGGVKKKNGEAYSTADLLVKWVPDEEPDATPEAVMALLRSKRTD